MGDIQEDARILDYMWAFYVVLGKEPVISRKPGSLILFPRLRIFHPSS